MQAAGVEIAVRGAANGDAHAWSALVDRFGGLIWAVARGHGLSVADADDVCQTTWLRLAEHLNRIREPARIGVWLATTARNEALRVSRRSRRAVPFATLAKLDMEAEATDVDRRILDLERDAALWKAFENLPVSCKVILLLLTADPPYTYADLSNVLGRPVGSIGPTRNRCLDRLRKHSDLEPSDAEADSTPGK